MSGSEGDDSSVTDKIRSHFIRCSKCEEGAKVCPCRSRREFLKKSAGAAGLVAALGDRDLIRTVEAGRQDQGTDRGTSGGGLALSTDDVFPQSVASGGPTDDGVILWTRVSDRALGEAEHDLGVEVATDPNFDDVLHTGGVTHDQVARNDNCVRYDLAGELSADEEYFYRFDYGGVKSRTGRCKTLPGPNGDVDEVTFAVVNCNHYQNGYFNAYDYVADHAADFILHLGDFIYESTGGAFTSNLARERNGPDENSPVRNLHDDATETIDGTFAWQADGYRELYKGYKSDEKLQRALERHTLIYTWDDHDVVDDRYWDYDANEPAAQGQRLPVERYANAIQAWLEHVPARVDADHEKIEQFADGQTVYSDTPPIRQLGLHDVFTLYDRLEFGDLIDLVVTDERFYREQPPSDLGPTGTFGPVKDQNGFVDPLQTTLDNTRDGDDDQYEFESEQDGDGNDPHHDDRTMLGYGQKRWMKDALRNSDATWTVWMNEVLLSPLSVSEPGSWLGKLKLGFLPEPDDHPDAVEVYHDAWSGYITEREEILDVARANADNFVALTGDMHAAMASRLHDDYGGNNPAGVEFMVPAMTSETPYEQMSEGGTPEVPKKPPVLTSDDPIERLKSALTMMNTHVKTVDFRTTGYAVVTVTEDHLDYKAFDVVRTVNDPRVATRVPALHKRKPNNDNLWWERARIDETQATAVLTPSDADVSVGESVTFDATDCEADFGSRYGSVAGSYEWDFGDGTTEDGGRQVQHSYDQPGAYEVELTYTARLTSRGGPRRDTDTASVLVVVTEDNEAPTAEIDVSNYDGPDDQVAVGDTVNLSASPSEDPDGYFPNEIERIEWDFGDGTTETGEPSTRGTPGVTGVTHSYEAPGDYTVELTLIDRDGASDTATETITVERGGVTADFDYESLDGERATVRVDQAVSFDAETADNDDAATYGWAFDDGTTATGASVEHTFDAADTYEVELTVTGPGGETADHTESVSVEPEGPEDVPGEADFTGEVAFGEVWTTTYTVADTSTALEVRMEGPPGSDFDLAATLDGSTPGAITGYDRVSQTVFPAETLRIDERFEPGDRIGVGVFATFGSGRFAVSVTEVSPEEDREEGKEGEQPTTPPGEGDGENGDGGGDDGWFGGWFDDMIGDAFGGWDDSDETGFKSDPDDSTGDGEETTGGDGDETGGGWFDDGSDGWLPGVDDPLDIGDGDGNGGSGDSGGDDDDDGLLPGIGFGDDDDSDRDSGSGDGDDNDGGDDGWFDWDDDGWLGGDNDDDDGVDGGSDEDDDSGGNDIDDTSSDDGGSDDGDNWDPTGGWENNFDQTGSYGGSGGSDDDSDPGSDSDDSDGDGVPDDSDTRQGWGL